MEVDARIAELSEAFTPCTPSGLAAELWKLNLEIGEKSRELQGLRHDRDRMKELLMQLMEKAGLGVIEGDHPTLRIVQGWEYDYTLHTGIRVPDLEFDR